MDYEKIIKDYYNNSYKICLVKNNIEKLRDSKSRLEKDLRNNNIKLTSNLKSKAFITIKKDITEPNTQEQAIEVAYMRLEEKVLTILQHIYKYERLLVELETKTNAIKFIIENLSDINKDFIQYYYRDKLSFTKTANKLFISESTARRQKHRALQEFATNYNIFNIS